jgi:hypothetical protein
MKRGLVLIGFIFLIVLVGGVLGGCGPNGCTPDYVDAVDPTQNIVQPAPAQQSASDVFQNLNNKGIKAFDSQFEPISSGHEPFPFDEKSEADYKHREEGEKDPSNILSETEKGQMRDEKYVPEGGENTDGKWWGSKEKTEYDQWDDEIEAKDYDKKGAAALDIEKFDSDEKMEKVMFGKDSGGIKVSADSLQAMAQDYEETYQKFHEKALSEKYGITLKGDMPKKAGYMKNGDSEVLYADGKVFDLKNMDGWTLEAGPNGEMTAIPPQGSMTPTAKFTSAGTGMMGSQGGGQQGAEQQLAGLIEKLGQALMGMAKEQSEKKEKEAKERESNKPYVEVAGNDEVKVDGGAGIELGDGEQIVQNCLGGLGENGECSDETKIVASGIDQLLLDNAEVYVPGETYAYTPVGLDTEMTFSGIAGNSPETISSASALASNYNLGLGGITGAVISGGSNSQYIKLIGHTVSLGGQKLVIDVLKSFDEVKGDGEKLWVRNGEMHMRFDGPKIYYSRQIKDSPHSFMFIKNEMDNDNYFELMEYTENRGRMIDLKGRVSVGDLMIKHPRKEGLNVAKVRQGMWVER